MGKVITCNSSFLRSAPAAGASVSLRSSCGTELGILQPNDGVDRQSADVWATRLDLGYFRLEPKTLLGELYLSNLIAGALLWDEALEDGVFPVGFTHRVW